MRYCITRDSGCVIGRPFVPRRLKLHEQVMAELLDDVAAGRYAEGDRLPREVDLAARYEVSRGVARETIQALRDRGVLTVQHGVGPQSCGAISGTCSTRPSSRRW